MSEQGTGEAPRVSQTQIGALLQRVHYVVEQRPGGTTSTFVHAFLDGKFHLATGEAACVDPRNFDAQVGYGIARRKAEDRACVKLWELEGYRLYCSLQS